MKTNPTLEYWKGHPRRTKPGITDSPYDDEILQDKRREEADQRERDMDEGWIPASN